MHWQDYMVCYLLSTCSSVLHSMPLLQCYLCWFWVVSIFPLICLLSYMYRYVFVYETQWATFISVFWRRKSWVFLESGTKNIIINGLSVKEQFLYQMPSIVIKLHSNVTVILLLWKQVFLTTCKKRSAMWNCKMTYNHALLINL